MDIQTRKDKLFELLVNKAEDYMEYNEEEQNVLINIRKIVYIADEFYNNLEEKQNG